MFLLLLETNTLILQILLHLAFVQLAIFSLAAVHDLTLLNRLAMMMICLHVCRPSRIHRRHLVLTCPKPCWVCLIQDIRIRVYLAIHRMDLVAIHGRFVSQKLIASMITVVILRSEEREIVKESYQGTLTC